MLSSLLFIFFCVFIDIFFLFLFSFLCRSRVDSLPFVLLERFINYVAWPILWRRMTSRVCNSYSVPHRVSVNFSLSLFIGLYMEIKYNTWRLYLMSFVKHFPSPIHCTVLIRFCTLTTNFDWLVFTQLVFPDLYNFKRAYTFKCI